MSEISRGFTGILISAGFVAARGMEELILRCLTLKILPVKLWHWVIK